MTDPLIVTASDIKNFLDCRRRWHLDFVWNYRLPERPTGPLALGTRVHAAIEHYYLGGDPVTEHERLARADIAVLEADPDTPPWVMDQLYEDIIVGRNCVALHQEWLATTGADDNYVVEAVEHVVEAPFLDGKVILRGKVDTLFRRRDNDFLTVNDIKTDGGWGGGTREQLERSWQPQVYLIALRALNPEVVIGGAMFTVIRKVKRPSRTSIPLVQRYPVPATARVAENKTRQLETILGEMLTTIERTGHEQATTGAVPSAYPIPAQHCAWCDYKQPCELLDESTESAVAMLDARYIRGGRHARYDREVMEP